jgi:hypothetical protein
MLFRTGYTSFARFLNEAQHYEKTPCTGESGNCAIPRLGSDTPPRIIAENLACDCEVRVAHDALWLHRLKADDLRFRIDRWPERFHI